MRVTFGTGYDLAMADVEQAATEMIRRQREVSTGIRVNTPSDDPSSAASAIRRRGEIAALDQYEKSADWATARGTVIDTVLSDMVNQLTSVRSTGASAVGSIQSDTQREATAKQLEALRDSLLSAVNTSFGGTYLFAGSASLDPPYTKDASGHVTAYAGDSQPLSVDIDRNRSAQITYDGSAVMQGTAGQDLFQTLQSLIDAVRANDQAGITAGLDEVAVAFDHVISVQSGVGADMVALENQTARIGDMRRANQVALSSDEDANMVESATKLSQANNVYQAALHALATRSQLSLLDYLE